MRDYQNDRKYFVLTKRSSIIHLDMCFLLSNYEWGCRKVTKYQRPHYLLVKKFISDHIQQGHAIHNCHHFMDFQSIICDIIFTSPSGNSNRKHKNLLNSSISRNSLTGQQPQKFSIAINIGQTTQLILKLKETMFQSLDRRRKGRIKTLRATGTLIRRTRHNTGCLSLF